MVGLTTQKACAHSKSPVARLIEKGISRIGKPLEDINTAIENAGKLKFINLKRMVCGYHFRSRTYDWFFRDSGGNDSGFS
jgi:hypothetical protein